MLHKNAQFRSSGFMPKPDQLTKAWLYQKRVFGPLLMTWLWRQGNSEITRIRSFLFTFEICLLQRGTIKSISDIKKDRKMNQGHKSHQNCQIKQCIWLCILAKSKDVNIFIKENHSHVNGSRRSLCQENGTWWLNFKQKIWFQKLQACKVEATQCKL